MPATIQTIRNVFAEWPTKVQPLFLELDTLIRDDSLRPEYRQRRERELRAEIDRVNTEYAKRIGEYVAEASREPTQRLRAGTSAKAEHLTEAQLVVEQYRGKTKQEQQHLVEDIAADLAAGDGTAARIKERAARALGIPLGPLAPQLNNADPIKRDARDSLDVITAMAELAAVEPIRARAAAGFGTPAEAVRLKEFASGRGLRLDVPFAQQVEPGYTPPGGAGMNALPEPYDPVRDKQRATAQRIGRDSSRTLGESEARYADRDRRHSTGEAQSDNINLLDS
jgi:hypothetical protein